MSRPLALIPAIVLIVLMAIAAFVLLRGGERETLTGGLIGRPAPHYALARLGGGPPVSNDEFRGRAYLINVFASWCVPCRAENSQLLTLRSRGVAILGVDYKDDPTAAADFLNNVGDPYWTVGTDPEGRFGLDIGIAGVPETFVLGADGRIRAVHRGPLTEEIVAREITPALAQR